MATARYYLCTDPGVIGGVGHHARIGPTTAAIRKTACSGEEFSNLGRRQHPGCAVREFYFDFPVCASASVCWVSYVEKPWTILLTGKVSVSLSYSITGTTPVFNHQSPGNMCGGPPALSLLLHQAGDNMSGQGQYSWYRWFSRPEAQPLALGDFTVTVPLTVDKWVLVFNGTPDQNAAGFATAIANMGQIGFGLGGGCFAAHGVAITSGSARFVIRGLSAQ